MAILLDIFRLKNCGSFFDVVHLFMGRSGDVTVRIVVKGEFNND